MIDVEQNTIGVLEEQLKEAMATDDRARADKLRQDIDAAYASLQKLNELNRQLRALKDAAEGESRNTRRGGAQDNRSLPGRRRQVANPQVGGLDGLNMDEERQQRERRANPNPNDNNRNENDWMADPDRTRDNPRRGQSRRLQDLNRAFDALLDAGETELAEQVQDLIDAENRLPDRAPQRPNRERDVQPNRDRDPQGNRRNRGNLDGPARVDEPDASGDPSTTADRDDQTRPRGRRGAPRRPSTADGPAEGAGSSTVGPRDRQPRDRQPRDRADSMRDNPAPSRDRNRTPSNELSDEIDDLEDKINQLREKLRNLKEDNRGDRDRQKG